MRADAAAKFMQTILRARVAQDVVNEKRRLHWLHMHVARGEWEEAEAMALTQKERTAVRVARADAVRVDRTVDRGATTSTVDAEFVIAQLRGSRWHRTDDGMPLSVDDELAWVHDGAENRFSISRTANGITTNGWWVAHVTFEAEQLASIEWRDESDRITWHRLYG